MGKDKDTEYMHFRVGENAGFLVQEIAQEKLFGEYNINGAIKVLTDSLGGLDLGLALRLLSGEVILFTDVKDQVFNTRPNTDKLTGFPKYLDKTEEIDKFISRKNRQVGTDGIAYYKIIEAVGYHFSRSKSVCFSSDKLMKTIANKDFDALMSAMRDSDEYVDKAFLAIEGAMKYVSNSYKFLLFKKKMFKLYPHLIKYDRGDHDILGIVRLKLNNLMSGELNEYIRKTKEMDDYFKAELKFNSLLAMEEEVKIKPTSPFPCDMDAGWISPTGEYYGMKGHIANSLHCKLADLIINSGLLGGQKLKDGYQVEGNFMLERAGWCKVHGDWVLFDANSDNSNKLTKNQRLTLEKYGANFDSGILRLGFMKHPCNRAKVGILDGAMLNKLFFSF